MQPNGTSDSEQEAESPKGRKRARANTDGGSHQLRDEIDETLRPGLLIRDTDG